MAATHIAKTIQAEFRKFVEENDKEPQYITCLIEYNDNGFTQECTIKLSLEIDEKEEDDIFYYCDSLSDLISICSVGSEDFVVTEFLLFS